MKKLLVFALVFALLLSGCSEKTPVEENPENPEIESSEVLKEEEPETDHYWEEFIEEMEKHGYSEEKIESLETYGFSREEIKAMSWVDVARNLSAAGFGFERKEVETALEFLRNENLWDETFIKALEKTEGFELLESFVSAVEKGESAFVRGIKYGYTMTYYFELSYEPGGMIKYSMVSEHLCSKAEFSAVYLNEVFAEFRNEEGGSFLISKIDKYPGEQLEFSAEQDVPGMPVTLESAMDKATEVMFFSLLKIEEYEYTEEYLETLEPICEGIFDIAGKPYYCIGFYENGNHMGATYYICAEESKIVFEGSAVDGGLMPFEYPAEPKIVLNNG